MHCCRKLTEVKQLAGDGPARDLFGTLAVALGRIRRSDLEAVNPSLVDDWAGDYFDEVLRKVRRMVMGDAESGYALAHPLSLPKNPSLFLFSHLRTSSVNG